MQVHMEIEKIKKYDSLLNQNIHMILYKFMAIILASGFFYRFIFVKFVDVNQLYEKDVVTAFMILPAMLWFFFCVFLKMKKEENERKSFVFEDVNVYSFLKNLGVEEKKLDMVYTLVVAKILNKIKDKDGFDYNDFQNKVSDKSLTYKSINVFESYKQL